MAEMLNVRLTSLFDKLVYNDKGEFIESPYAKAVNDNEVVRRAITTGRLVKVSPQAVVQDEARKTADLAAITAATQARDTILGQFEEAHSQFIK
jgi:hypothetical protein